MPKSIKEILQLGAIKLKESNIENYSLDARILLQYVLGYSHEKLLLEYNEIIDEEQIKSYEDFLAERIKSKPVDKIIGKKEFYGREFIVSENVLSPRPDTEIIIDAAKALIPDTNTKLKILDIGTGSGCLLASLLLEYPTAEGLAVDISEEALKIAKQNLHKFMLEKRARLMYNDMCNNISENFDLIVTNPPYIPRTDEFNLPAEVRIYDPSIALYGGETGLDYYILLANSVSRILNPDGFFMTECGHNQAEDIKNIFNNQKLEFIKYFKDLSGINRVLTFKKK